MDLVDNKELEEIIGKMDMGEHNATQAKEFFELFKESQLFMPVIMSDDFFKDIDDVKEGDVFTTNEKTGFDINFIKMDDGRRAVPLFTSSKLMESTGLRSSAIALFMSDLADMLKQAPDRYFMVTVNPFTDLTLDIPMKSFLNLFNDSRQDFFESIQVIIDALRQHSVELEENSTLFLRLDENVMVENAEDDVFTAAVPFYVSSNPKYREDLKYTNILLMPESRKILPIGPVENGLDVIIAPGTEFHLEDRLDEFTSLWMCSSQPFYDE